MKIKIFFFAVLSLFSVVVLSGCQNQEEKTPRSAAETNAEIKPGENTEQTSYSEDWEKFRIESEKKIQKNEEKIALFKKKLKKSGSAIRAKYNEEISNLEETNKEMKKTLVNYKNNGKNVWTDFKTGFNNAMDRLGKSIDGLFEIQD